MSQKKIILLVDDDLDLLENTSFMIKSMGHDVITAQDGEEAVATYKEANPHLTIMDIKMPKMDGYEAFYKIKQYDPDAKVILISAYYIDEEKHQKAVSLSLLTTISKPYTFEMLEEHIKKFT
ncbi:MAG TPA: response regulator [Candidatus Nitrosotalea sp.]|nr:response regulator [Candidatus Nitrosotalea sp.]